jgi:hypothetical protein
MMHEVVGAYVPKARREWLSWGGELLFPELHEEVEKEEREKENAKRREEEAKKRKEEEEEEREAAQAKAATLKAQKAALGKAQRAIMAEFWAKTLSRDELQQRNAELVAEAYAIEKEEGEKDEDEVEEDTVEFGGSSQVVAGKRKADEVEEDDEGEDEVEAKRMKGVVDGLLKFAGLVSCVFSFIMRLPN